MEVGECLNREATQHLTVSPSSSTSGVGSLGNPLWGHNNNMNYSDISDKINVSVSLGNIIDDTFYVSPDLPPWVIVKFSFILQKRSSHTNKLRCNV